MAKRFLAPRRYLAVIGFAAAMAVIPVCAFAQDELTQPKKKPPEAPAKLPKMPADRAHGLDFLFRAPEAGPDEVSAKPLQGAVLGNWPQTPSDTAALLM